jgi:S-adenosylmethionine synthetase
MRLFSTEQVSKYHPDKYADQISDAILDAALIKNKNARVAVETLVKDRKVIIAGETSETFTNEELFAIINKVAFKLRYQVDEMINLLGKQSEQINNAVDGKDADDPAAGDQGIMFGYATSETSSYLPFGFHIANHIIKHIENYADEGRVFKGDAKVQVTVDLDKKTKESIHTILVSACHYDRIPVSTVKKVIEAIVKNSLQLNECTNIDEVKIIANSSGKWTLGGPEADSGLTGRKIVCDQYGGFVPVGGGAFSGKDPSKVDRSGSYAAREIAVRAIENFKVKGLTSIIIQIAYGIGIKQPLSVNTLLLGDLNAETQKEILEYINRIELTPGSIIKRLRLREIKYSEFSGGCHYYGKHW